MARRGNKNREKNTALFLTIVLFDDRPDRWPEPLHFVRKPVRDKSLRLAICNCFVDDDVRPLDTATFSTNNNSDLSVLIVDDNALNLKIIQKMLKGLGYHNLKTAINGHEAVELVKNGGPFDLVLMDLMMPDMSGVEATRRIRALPGVAQPYAR